MAPCSATAPRTRCCGRSCSPSCSTVRSSCSSATATSTCYNLQIPCWRQNVIKTFLSTRLVQTLLAGGCLMAAQLGTKQTLTLEIAKQMAAAAAHHAAQNKWTMVIAIVDDGGNLMYLEK